MSLSVPSTAGYSRLSRPAYLAAISMAMFVSAVASAQAQTVTVLHSFNHNVPPHGEPLQPQWEGIIAQGQDGNLYSTSPVNGAGAGGAVWRMTPSGLFSVVHAFSGTYPNLDGNTPYSGVTLGTDGYLYGTTGGGGITNSIGTVFKTTLDGNLTILHNFLANDNKGINPYAPPVEGPDGNYYGTTFQGSTGSTIYRITPSGTLTTIY